MTTHWLRFRGTHFPIRRQETLIGRSAYCSVVISNELASRQHCALRITADGILLVDLASRNGTWLNGARVTEPQLLSPGDQIRIGTDIIELFQDAPSQPRAVTETAQSPVAETPGGAELTTRTDIDVIDFIEELTRQGRSGSGDGPPPEAVASAIEAMLRAHRLGARPLDRRQTARLRTLLESIESSGLQGRDSPAWVKHVRDALSGVVR